MPGSLNWIPELAIKANTSQPDKVEYTSRN